MEEKAENVRWGGRWVKAIGDDLCVVLGLGGAFARRLPQRKNQGWRGCVGS